jgi:hypothetical protein
MTTLISLAARDFIVVGCDSLATTMADMVHPWKIGEEFFDDQGQLKLGSDGLPLLKTVDQIWERAQSMPVDNLPSVTKLFDLEPYRACLLFSGASRIGEMTIQNIVAGFKAGLPNLKAKPRGKGSRREPYTMEMLANTLKEYICQVYGQEFKEEWRRPTMDIILSGYSEQYREPELWRIKFSFDRHNGTFEAVAQNQVPRKDYNVIFGGQYDVVQRIVNGIDTASYWCLRDRMVEKLRECFAEVEQQVLAHAPALQLQRPNFWEPQWNPFGDDHGGIKGIFTDIGSLSEQAGIDLVYFLVSVMIQAQAFSSAIPTVGGKIHVAILTKDCPFRWISEESYTFEGKPVPKFPPNARD